MYSRHFIFRFQNFVGAIVGLCSSDPCFLVVRLQAPSRDQDSQLIRGPRVEGIFHLCATVFDRVVQPMLFPQDRTSHLKRQVISWLPFCQDSALILRARIRSKIIPEPFCGEYWKTIVAIYLKPWGLKALEKNLSPARPFPEGIVLGWAT